MIYSTTVLVAIILASRCTGFLLASTCGLIYTRLPKMKPKLIKKDKDVPAAALSRCQTCNYPIGPKGLAYHSEFLCSIECVCGGLITTRTKSRHLDCERLHQEYERRLRIAAAEYRRKQDYFSGGIGPARNKAAPRETQGGLPSLGKKR